MDIQVEAERLVKIYNSMSKEEFAEFVKSNEQAQADMKVTSEWLEKELRPLIEAFTEIADSIVKTLTPIVNDLLAKKESLSSVSRIQNTMSYGA